MSTIKTVGGYVQSRIQNKEDLSLTYYIELDGEQVYPIHSEFANIDIVHHNDIVVYACKNDLAEHVEGKQLTGVLYSTKISTADLMLSGEERNDIMDKAEAWAEASGEKEMFYSDYKTYVVVDRWDGVEHQVILVEFKDEEFIQAIELKQEEPMLTGFHNVLGQQIKVIFEMGQDGYKEDTAVHQPLPAGLELGVDTELTEDLPIED